MLVPSHAHAKRAGLAQEQTAPMLTSAAEDAVHRTPWTPQKQGNATTARPTKLARIQLAGSIAHVPLAISHFRLART